MTIGHNTPSAYLETPSQVAGWPYGASPLWGDAGQFDDSLIDNHLRHWSAVFFLFGRIHSVRLRIHCIDFNDRTCVELGYSRQELMSMTVYDIAPGFGKTERASVLEQIKESGMAIIERVHRRKDGTEFPVEMTLREVHLDRTYGVAVARDITQRKKTEEALKQSVLGLKEAQRLAQVGSWESDLATDTVTWSEQLYGIAGRDPKLPLPKFKEFSQVFTAESWEWLQRAVDEALRTGTFYELDLEMVRPDGTTRWVRVRGEAQRDAMGHVIRFRGTAQDITERKLVEVALASVSRKLIEAQEQERSRIARELHDDLNQRLAMLAFELEQLQGSPSEVRSRVQELRKQMTEISDYVHALSHDLNSSKLEYLGAVRGMKSWCTEFGGRQGIQIEFKNVEVQTSVAPEVGLCLFRVLQQALHNAAKHSGVRRIEVQLREDSGEIHLVVSDLGRGFDVETAMQGRGLGLASMQERVRLVNGTIEIQSKPMGGTTVHVRVPLRSENASQRVAG
jgi:PAS domain S-box-containing protein